MSDNADRGTDPKTNMELGVNGAPVNAVCTQGPRGLISLAFETFEHCINVERFARRAPGIDRGGSILVAEGHTRIDHQIVGKTRKARTVRWKETQACCGQVCNPNPRAKRATV